LVNKVLRIVIIGETERLILRRMALTDAAFIHELVNEPDWLQFIGDRGVRTVEDARRYIETGPLAMYERFGFGLYLVALRPGDLPIGICGLLKRDTLSEVDIGFALLHRFAGRGYACEAAEAVVAHARDELGLCRLVAIAARENHRSLRLLEKLGLRFERMARVTPERPESVLYARDL
jgi:RimJ/RimL family protein N-acetyltransferase